MNARSTNPPTHPATRPPHPPTHSHLDQQVVKLLQHQLPKGRPCTGEERGEARGVGGMRAAARGPAVSACRPPSRPRTPPACSPTHPPPTGCAADALGAQQVRARTGVGRQLVPPKQPPLLGDALGAQPLCRVHAIVRQHLWRGGCGGRGGGCEGVRRQVGDAAAAAASVVGRRARCRAVSMGGLASRCVCRNHLGGVRVRGGAARRPHPPRQLPPRTSPASLAYAFSIMAAA